MAFGLQLRSSSAAPPDSRLAALLQGGGSPGDAGCSPDDEVPTWDAPAVMMLFV